MKPQGTNDFQRVFLKRSNAGNSAQVVWHDGGNNFEVNVTNNGITQVQQKTDTTYALNEWHRVALTYEGVGSAHIPHLYINGVEPARSAGSGLGNGTIDNFWIGERSDGAGDLTGFIAYVSVYNRVLTLQECEQQLLFPGSITKGILLFAPLFGASPEPDYSGNGNHGTVTGATVSADNPPINGIFYPPTPNLYYAGFSQGTDGLYYLRDTQTEPGTTGTPGAINSILDLSTAQGTTASLGTGTLAGFATYESVPAKRFTITVGAGVIADGSGSYDYSIKITASTEELLAKWKFQRVNSSGVMQAESGFSTELSTGGGDIIGTWTGTLVWDAGTWAAGDRLVLSIHGVDDGPGSHNFTMAVNDADSWVDAPLVPAGGGGGATIRRMMLMGIG